MDCQHPGCNAPIINGVPLCHHRKDQPVTFTDLGYDERDGSSEVYEN